MSSDVTVEDLKVVENRFTGEGADLTLLHWLRHAEQAIESLPSDDLLPQVQPLHAFFLKILLPSPSPTLPKPGRPIRQLLTRCMVKLHHRVESRSLFDFVQALTKALSDGGSKHMSSAENVARVACWYCIGEIMREHGSNMMSFMAEISMTSIKVLRNSNLSVILRAYAVTTFSKSLVSAGKALPDGLHKELTKALRNGLTDRALPVQRACAETFISLQTYTTACPLKETLDAIAPLVVRSLEHADHLTRRSLSLLLAHFLAATQIPGSGIVVPDRKAAAKRDTDDAGTEPTVVTSAVEEKGTKTRLTILEMLRYLSTAYNRPQSPRKLRNAIIDVYATLFTSLGATYIESNYAEIVKHLMDELVLPSRSQSSRFEILSARDSVNLLLRDLIGVRLLSESGQVMAIREWTNNYLKKWQSVPLPGQRKTNKYVLNVALREIAGLLESLGNASPAIIELLAEPLVRLLSHEAYSVRLSASYALRRFCAINPGQLPRMLGILFTDINKDLGILGTPTASKDVSHRVIGKTFALSALIAASNSRPLYVSHDVSTKVFDLATSLLKKAGDHDISVSMIEVQVAWYLIAALMSLGPSFVKLHLPQLLVLWRNALPKPTSKDSSVGERGETDWSFLLLVRECALAAVLNFLRQNMSLVNIDVARRLATLFSNTLNFVNGFATAYAEALREQAASPAGVQSPIFTAKPSLVDREATLRRRVLQCFTALGPSSATESMQPALLQAAVTVFADPENYSGSAAQAAIAAQSGTFTSIWQSTDGYGFGVTTLLRGREDGDEPFLNRDKIEMSIESQLSHPILGSLEHDFLALLPAEAIPSCPAPPPSQTGVIDAGVELFSAIFPHQSLEGQIQSLGTLSSHMRSSKLERNPGRKQAVVANTVAALRLTLINAESAGAKAKRNIGSTQISDMIKSLLQDAILDSNPAIRTAAADAMGSLSSLAGSAYLSTQIQWLVDQIVNNRVPESRAGCAVAFGSIYSSVGGLSGGPILKTIVNILMSLATDPHPVVHFYAMSALTKVVDSASLSYEPFIPTTLGMLSNIYLLDTHEPEGGSLGSVNLRGDLPAYQVICRILHALIGVIGPELQEPGKIRSLVFLLVHEFGEETDEGLSVEAIKCVQQFLMFAPSEVDIPRLVQTFRTHLASSRRPLKVAAITALYQIVQRDAVLISKVGGNQLVEDLFGLLDDDPSIVGVREVITSWLTQTAAALPSGWIDLCQRIMTRTQGQASSQKLSQTIQMTQRQAITTSSGFMDDEGESLGAAEMGGGNNTLSSRWRTQLFALVCLHNIVQAVADGGKEENFDPLLARRLGVNMRHMLFSRVGDLIRMAFSASAALVEEVRLGGLVVLRDVIEKFSSSADPDFEASLLLEQHQAPIAAALTPSFGTDSTPEILASAVQVCAVFVGSGVVREVGRMGRILKLLTGALEQCKDGEMTSLGEVHNLSSNAAVMLKVSILAAWAELQVAAVKREYLKDVVRPYRWLLGPFWVGTLRDYAQLRTDPEMGMIQGGMDAGVGRDVLLPYYEQAVPKILHAVAISLSLSDPYLLSALDGQPISSPSQEPSLPVISPTPCANFYIVYGLAFESLVKSMSDSHSFLSCVALKAMTSLVHPRLSGTTIFSGSFFDELCTVCYRIAMSEPALVKSEMVQLLSSFIITRQSNQSNHSDISKISDISDSGQTRRILAILVFVLRQTIPSPEIQNTFNYNDTLSDRVTFLKDGFTALCKVIECVEMVQRAELLAVGIHLFGDLLKDEGNMDLAGGCLGCLKGLLEMIWKVQVPGISIEGEKVIHGLLSACLGNVDDMRTRVNPVANTKIKNNLLAMTLVLTSLPTNVKLSRDVLEQVGYVMGQYLGVGADRPELGLTAVHCTSTLLTASLRPSPVLSHLPISLLPPIITFLADSTVSPSPPIEAIKETIKSLVSWCLSIPDTHRARAFGILLPTLSLLLDPESTSASVTTALHSISTSALLGLAQNSPKDFREATLIMSPEERTRLERSIRDAVGDRGGGGGAGGVGVGGMEKKGIELKSFV
ncbi:hypothetical protein TREMEDRAFT_74089 [Tremella mesenterica DSM 1558]|uniref:uncharacterized protein n=1 Tax=Tremella mesenterica (strain ATCC 24925 / CBS 8224 / DSM 1558 / NBRC 9311 / NRRL Y-6157 / RJB 2259-6 / UBC 559-6) TaxID=578456 RepID=UPI0003F493CB|nr:uncharacterized protein TREMEDRAFT_74089 [Tremella mesenterica DSM 1558]EIW68556.1 hypothetical protein TREMEDRAFT_74089 [Tremella mesenterica DSM 1558]